MELKSTETGYVNKKNQKTLVRHQSQGQIITSGFIRWNVQIVVISILQMALIFGRENVKSAKGGQA